MTEIEVKVPESPSDSYKVRIGSGMLGQILSKVEDDFGSRGLFVLTDSNVANAGHLEKLLAGKSVPHFIIDPAGEVSKNISTVIAIIESMEKAFLGRDTVVVALGGGTVGDIGAFAASIFKRGVPVVQIPTTTVSQADSSIGGKSGVDSSLSKNAFGTFWHPSAVYVDVETLKTLDDRQYRAGLVESVKHALIADSEYFEFFESNIDAILSRDMEVLSKIAKKNCAIKASVVEQDPTEKNMRRMLNYGHTIGHAVESASGFDLLHGEAVAVGIIGAAIIENKMMLSDGERIGRIRSLLEKLSVPVKIPAGLDRAKLLEAIRRDKKAVQGWPNFVLLSDIGKVYCTEGQYAVKVQQQVVEQTLDELAT